MEAVEGLRWLMRATGCPRQTMIAAGSQWRLLEVHGGCWRPLMVDESQWMLPAVYDSCWKSMKVAGSPWRLLKVHGGCWRCLMVDESLWMFRNVIGRPWWLPEVLGGCADFKHCDGCDRWWRTSTGVEVDFICPFFWIKKPQINGKILWSPFGTFFCRYAWIHGPLSFSACLTCIYNIWLCMTILWFWLHA